MNTLSKAMTTKFFKVIDGFRQLEAKWSDMVKEKQELPADAHLLYAILRGKDWRKGFNIGKPDISNGEDWNIGVYKAFQSLEYKVKNRAHILKYRPTEDLLGKFGDIFVNNVGEELFKYLPESKEIRKAARDGEQLPEAYKAPVQV